MHEAWRWELRGTIQELSSAARCGPGEFTSALDELSSRGVAEVELSDDQCHIFSPWMQSYIVDRSTGGMRAWIHRHRHDLIRKLKRRDGTGCRVCGTTENIAIDHKFPIVAGGTNDLSNLQLLCKSCNSRKGAKC